MSAGSTAPVRVAVVGLGTIADEHLTAYQDSPEAELVAVCDIFGPRAHERAEQYGVRAVTDPAEIFADPTIDAVSICTRNDTHAELTIAALKAGKHVLIEKPMTSTLAQAEEVAAVAAVSTGKLQVAYVRRFSPNATVLKQFIDAGELGPIYYAKASCLRRVGNPGGWFADKTKSGGGPLIDLGVHFLDICWYLMGCPRVSRVTGVVFQKLGNRANVKNLSRYLSADYDPTQNSVEDLASALVTFANGAVLHFDTSYSLHGPDEVKVQLFGEHGGATLEPALKIFTEKHDTLLDITPVIDSLSFDPVGYRKEIDYFLATARGEVAEVAPANHGLELMKIIAAIYESAAQGREIVF